MLFYAGNGQPVAASGSVQAEQPCICRAGTIRAAHTQTAQFTKSRNGPSKPRGWWEKDRPVAVLCCIVCQVSRAADACAAVGSLLLYCCVQLMQAGVSAEEFEHTIADPELLMEVRRAAVCFMLCRLGT